MSCPGESDGARSAGEGLRRATRAGPLRELAAFATGLDFSTEASRAQALKDAAVVVARNVLTPAQGNAIAARARAVGKLLPAETKKPAPVVVSVSRSTRRTVQHERHPAPGWAK